MDKVIVLLSLVFFGVSAGWAQVPPTDPATQGSLDPNAPALKNEVPAEEQITRIQSFLEPFEYDRERVRDPFEAQASSAPLKPGEVYGPFLELQQYRLSEYRLKGLVWRTDNPIAIFSSPDKKDFRLTIKDYIGENFGYIAMIREKEVVVIQTIEENNRRYSTTKVVFLDKSKE